MGLGGWLKRKAEEKAVRVTASKYDTPEEVQAALEGEMSDGMKAWVHSIVAAAVGGAVGVLSVTLADPSKIDVLFTLAGLTMLWKSALVGAVLGVVATLKQSPLPPKDAPKTARAFPGPGAGMILLALLLLPAAARADEPAQAPPVRVDVAAGVELAMSEAGSKPVPSARVSIEGPLVLGSSRRGIVGATVDILGLPGATTAPSLEALDTWTAIRAEGSIGVALGDLEQGGQHVQTRLTIFGGFSNRFGSDPAPVDRTSRAYGLGVELRELVGGARLRVALGHDDAVGESFGPHVLIAGAIPIAGTHGIAALGAEAALAIRHLADGSHTTDRVTVRLLASLPK